MKYLATPTPLSYLAVLRTTVKGHGLGSYCLGTSSKVLGTVNVFHNSCIPEYSVKSAGRQFGNILL